VELLGSELRRELVVCYGELLGGRGAAWAEGRLGRAGTSGVVGEVGVGAGVAAGWAVLGESRQMRDETERTGLWR
jgi:hypothetical protein